MTKNQYIAAGMLALVSFDCATWMVVNANSQKVQWGRDPTATEWLTSRSVQTNAAPDLAAKLKDVSVLNRW